MKLKLILSMIILFGAVIPSVRGGDEWVLELDPTKDADRARLFQALRTGSSGEKNLSAEKLAKAGYIDDLIEILKVTSDYNTMQAIAQTGDERVIPVFESRLKADPKNRYLVGSLTFVRSEKAAPILIKILKDNPDGDKPKRHDLVGSALRALMWNKAHDAIPLLRERFSAISLPAPEFDKKESVSSRGRRYLAKRKTMYAQVLSSLRDTSGIPYLKEEMRNELRAGRRMSGAFESMESLMMDLDRIIPIEDESIFEELLPELIEGLGRRELYIKRAATKVLGRLTRLDFADDQSKWRNWYKANNKKHPIYSRPLDRAAKRCLAHFLAGVRNPPETSETLRAMAWFARFGFGNGFSRDGRGDWKLDIDPTRLHLPLPSVFRDEKDFKMPPHVPRDKLKDFKLFFEASLSEKASEPENLIFRQELESIRIVVTLAFSTPDGEAKNQLIKLAKEACSSLFEYQKQYGKGK